MGLLAQRLALVHLKEDGRLDSGMLTIAAQPTPQYLRKQESKGLSLRAWFIEFYQ